VSTEHLLKNAFLDKSSYIPLYIQVRDILKGLISSGTLKPGDQLPSENELSSAFNISRMTVRQATQELLKEGAIIIRRGDGTFVNPATHTQMLLKLEGFSSEMAKLGYRNHSRVLEMERISDDESYEDAYVGLGLDESETLVRISRVRYVEDTPFALETSYLPAFIGDGLLEPRMADDASIYAHIEKDLHIRLSRADHVIQPGLAEKQCSELLEIDEGSPVLRLHGTTFSMKNQPVEYLEGIYRGDKYELKVVITK